MGRMNWVETIALIQKAGYSQSQIAEECGCAQPTINELAKGKTKNPHYALGESLKALLAKAKRKLANEARA
jgi:transcriptional regulator with XRE-family HTH domain